MKRLLRMCGEVLEQPSRSRSGGKTPFSLMEADAFRSRFSRLWLPAVVGAGLRMVFPGWGCQRNYKPFKCTQNLGD